MFDLQRSILSLTASTKLTNIIGQLFAFRDTCRPSDLLALLDDIEGRIVDSHNQIQIDRYEGVTEHNATDGRIHREL